MTLTEIVDVLRATLADPPLLLEPSAQLAEVEALLTIETLARAGQVARLADVDASEASVQECGRATRSWLVEEMRLGPGEATRRMKLMRELPAYPLVQGAFGSAEISADHATVILAGLADVPVEFRDIVEPALVDVARVDTPLAVSRAIDPLLEACGAVSSKDEAAARRYARRGVLVAETFAGTGSLAGTLTPEATAKLRLALATAALPVPPDDERSMAQRHHDALVEICDFYLDQADELPAVNRDRPRVVVSMTLETLLGRLHEQWPALDDGLRVAPETARRLACDAEFVPAVLGARGEVLDLGRSTRDWSLAIRRAAWLRDGGRCAFPKCRRRCVDLHHIVWWGKGGRTELDNAAWLCSFHHWLVHEGGWVMRRDPGGGYTWTASDGRQRSSPRHPEAA